MPSISRLLIRTAAAYLVAAMICAVLAVLPAEVLPAGARGGLTVVTVHLLTVGWLTQLIFGVALWMFPRPRGRREISDRRLDRMAYGSLNTGLLARMAVEPGWSVPPGGGAWRWTLLLSAVLQWAAVLYFALRLWSRVRSR